MSDGAAPATLQVDVYLTPEDRLRALREDVREGLTSTPKELPPKWFYDERGSELFEEITRLPEYYLTGRERIILAERADDVARLTAANTLVEPGSGSSEKTRLLLDAMVEAGHLRRFVPFDVSEQALREAAAAIAEEYPGIEVHGVVGDFERNLVWLPEGRRRLFAFLGSSIGNLTGEQRAGFLSRSPRAARYRRGLAARRRSRQGPGAAGGRVQRLTRCDRGVQPQRPRTS